MEPLTKDEKALLTIFKDQGASFINKMQIMVSSRLNYLGPPNHKPEKILEIVEALENKGYVYFKENRDGYLFLSKKGEEHLYR